MTIRTKRKPLPDDVKDCVARLWPDMKADTQRLGWLALYEMYLMFWPPCTAASDAEYLDQCVVVLKSYIDDLREFDDDALTQGWTDVRRHYKEKGWPPISTLRSACLDVTRRRPVIIPDDTPLWKRPLAENLLPTCFKSWITPLTLLSVDDNIAEVEAQSDFQRHYVQRHYADAILRSLRREYPDLRAVRFIHRKPARKETAL